MQKKRRAVRGRRVLALSAALVQISAVSAFAATDDHWINAGGGTWDDPTNWDQGSAPVTTDYNGIVDLQTADQSQYEVDIVDDFSVNSITLDSTYATIVHSGGTVSTPTLTINNGTYQLNGGTLSGTTITANGGQFMVGSNGGGLDAVTLASDLTIDYGGTVAITNNLTLSNSTLTLLDGPLDFGDGLTQSINGDGTIQITGGGYDYVTARNGTLSIGSGISVVTTGSGTAYLGYYDNSYITNSGTLSATSGNTLVLAGGTLTNNGMLDAEAGGTVSIQCAVTGLGSFSASNGMGTVELAGGGILLNDGTTTTLSDVLTLNGGTISGGTISGGPIAGYGPQLVIGQSGGTLDGVTLAANVSSSSSGYLTIVDGLTLSGSTVSITSGNLSFSPGESQLIDGNGTIQLAGYGGYLLTSGTLTVGSGITIEGTGYGGTAIGTYDEGLLTNNGTITADSGVSVAISVGTLTNNGTLLAQSGGTISIQSSVAGSDLGSFSTSGGQGTVELGSNGIMLNTGATTTLADTLTLNGGTIEGGTINAGTNSATGSVGELAVGPDGGLLDGTTLGVNVSTDGGGNLQIVDGLTLANSTVSITNGNMDFGTGLNQTLDGNGTISLTGAGASLLINQGTLTIGSGINVVGSSPTSSTIGVYGNSVLINNGTLTAGDGTTLDIDVGTLTNNGTLSALAGGTVSIQSTVAAGELGYFSTSGGMGTVELGNNGILLNTGSTTTLTDILTLNGGTITGGTVAATSGGQLVVGSSGTLDGVTLATDVSDTVGRLYVVDGVNLTTSTISISNQGVLDFGNGLTQTIGGTGTIQLSGTGGDVQIANGTLTIGSGINVIGSTSGSSDFGGINGNNTLINSGTITATSGNTFIIDTGTFTNSGILSAMSGGTISIRSTMTPGGLGSFSTDSGNGTVELGNGGNLLNANTTATLTDILTLNGGTITGGTIAATSAGQLAVGGGGGTLDGVTLATNFSDSNGRISVFHGISLSNSTVSISNSGVLDFGNGLTQTIDGSGTIQLGGTGGDVQIANGTLTIGAGINVIGSTSGSSDLGGTNGNNTLINSGTITANSGNTFIIDAGTFTNNGVLSAMSGGTISIRSTVTPGGLGSFSTDSGNGTVELASNDNLLNANNTTALTDVLTLNGGTISGGTLSASGSGQLAVGTSGGTLDDVTLASNFAFTSTQLRIVNGLGLSNATVSLGDSGYLDFRSTPAQSITVPSGAAGGTIQFNSTQAAWFTYLNALTIGAGVNVVDAAAGSLAIADYTSSLVNNGTITANSGSTFIVEAGTFTNSGTLSAQSGGTIDLGTTITPGGLGSLNTHGGTGTITLGATLQNAGTTTNLTDILTLAGGTISGGTLTSSGNGALLFGQNSTNYYSTSYFIGGTLDGVTLATNLTLAQGTRLYIQDDLHLDNATITASDLDYTDGGVLLQGSNTIDGTGTIVLGNQQDYDSAGIYGSNGTLTIGANVTIDAVYGGYIGDTDVVNNGTIKAESGATLHIAPPYFTPSTTLFNDGTLDAEAGGTIGIACTVAPGGLGFFNTHGGAGTVELEANGILQNTNTTTTLTDILSLNGGTISGGTLAAATGGALRAGPNGGTLSGITLAADFTVPAAIHITNGFTLFNHAITVNNGAIAADSTGSFALSGTSSISEAGNSTATFGGALVLAPAAADRATYTLSAGKLVAQKGFYVASAGVASFNQSAGSTTVTGVFGVGNAGVLTSGNGNGSAIVTGGSVYADTLLLGDTNNGGGDYTQSGLTTTTVGGGAHLNDLNVEGGSFTVLNQAPPAGEDPELNRAIVGGYLSDGAMHVDGGTVVSPILKLGVTSGNTGTYTESAGVATFGTMGIGNDGTLTSGSGVGMADLTGGTVYTDTLLLGSSAGGSGDLTLEASTNNATTPTLTIGGGAHLNDLNVKAGRVNVLNQAAPAGEDAELYQALVGGYLTNGALIVSGGTVTSPYLKLGITAGKTGTFNLTGGVVSLTALYLGNDISPLVAKGVGIANLSGGSLSVGSILIGSSAGGVGSLNISAAAAIEVTHAITISSGSHFNFTGGNLTLNGAAFSHPSDPCVIGDGNQAAELHVHNSTVSCSGATVTIAAHATLDGGGGITDGSVGTVSLSSTNITLSGSSSTLHLAVGGNPTVAGNAGTTFDQITESNGTFTVGGATLQILPLSNYVQNVPYPVVVASNGGSINYSTAFSGLTIDPSSSTPNATYTVNYSPTEIDVTFTGVPEPTSLSLVGVTGVMMLRRRNKRAT